MWSLKARSKKMVTAHQYARTGLLSLLCMLFLGSAIAGEEERPSPEKFLPEEAVFFLKVGDWQSWANGVDQTSLYKIAQEPEIQAFFAGPLAKLAFAFKNSRQKEKDQPPPNQPVGNEDQPKDDLESAIPGPLLLGLCKRNADEENPDLADLVIILGTKDLDKYVIETLSFLSQKFLPEFLRDIVDFLVLKLTKRTDKDVTYQNAKLSILHVGPYQPTLTITNKHLIFSTSTALCKRVIDGMSKTLPKRLVDSSGFKSCNITGKEQVSAYLNVAATQEMLGRAIGAEDAKGLENLKAVAWSVRMDGPAFESKTGFILKEGRKGILGALSTQPVNLSGLKHCPTGCLFAAGLRVQEKQLWDVLSKISKARSKGQGAKRWEAMEKKWAAENRNLKNEFAQAFAGDVLVASQAGEEGAPAGALFSQVAMLTLKNRAKAESLLLELLNDSVTRRFPNADPTKILQQIDFEGHKIIYIRKPQGALGTEPKYVLTATELLVSADMQTIKSALSNGKGGNLANSPRFKDAIQQAGGKLGAVFIYVDWGQMYASTFNLGAKAMKLLGSLDVLAKLGIDINLLPSPEVVTKHLFPSIATVRVSESGMVLTSRSPLPSAEVLAPPVTAVVSAVAAFAASAKMVKEPAGEKKNPEPEKGGASK